MEAATNAMLWIILGTFFLCSGGLRRFHDQLRWNLAISVPLTTGCALLAYPISANTSLAEELMFYVPLNISLVLLLDYLRRKFALTDHSDWNF